MPRTITAAIVQLDVTPSPTPDRPPLPAGFNSQK